MGHPNSMGLLTSFPMPYRRMPHATSSCNTEHALANVVGCTLDPMLYVGMRD